MWTGIVDRFSGCVDSCRCSTCYTGKQTYTGRSCSVTPVRTDSEFAGDPPKHITHGNRPNVPPSFLRRVVNEEASSASRNQYERFPLKILFARRDIEFNSRYPGSLSSMLTRSRIWPGRCPSTPPLLLPAKYLMTARTDSRVAHNREHWSGKGTILVSTGAGVCLERSTAMTSSVASATESVQTTSQSAAEMSPSISLVLTEALRRLWNVIVGEVLG